MRKVLLKIVLLVLIAVGIISTSPFIVKASEPCTTEVVSGEEYTYEKIIIDGVVWIVVIDRSGAIFEIYPESCGGPHLGGH